MEPSDDINALAREAVDCGFHLHREFGPGMLESVYEALLKAALEARGHQVSRQVPIALEHAGQKFEEAFRVDLLVGRRLVIEVKSTERPSPVHAKQALTYLRVMRLPLALLINFGMPKYKDGVERVINSHRL